MGVVPWKLDAACTWHSCQGIPVKVALILSGLAVGTEDEACASSV